MYTKHGWKKERCRKGNIQKRGLGEEPREDDIIKFDKLKRKTKEELIIHCKYTWEYNEKSMKLDPLVLAIRWYWLGLQDGNGMEKVGQN